MSIFGPWNALWTRDQERVPVPVGARCVVCSVTIQAYDTGQMVELIGSDAAAEPCHRGCFLLPLLGHYKGICYCTEYDGAISWYHAGLKLDLAMGAIQYATMMQRLALGTSDSQDRERSYTNVRCHRA